MQRLTEIFFALLIVTLIATTFEVVAATTQTETLVMKILTNN